MKSFCLLFSFLWCCSLTEASTLHGNLIQELLSQSSGLSVDQLNAIKIGDFVFDVGVVGNPRIVTGMNGGSVVLRWSNDKSSLILIRVYAQKRYDKYVEDLVIPMDIIKGISNETSKALFDGNSLRNSWIVGKVPQIGNYCVGKHLPGMGPVPVNSGFFFDDKYGFCLQISTPENSGVGLEAVERIGKGLLEAIGTELKSEGVSPNPLDRIDEPFAPAARSEKNAGTIQYNGDNAPKPKPDQSSETMKNPQAAISRGFWVLGLSATSALLAMLLVWRKIWKK